jgi:isoquinoline 1-oxidoreductase alpha subunit
LKKMISFTLNGKKVSSSADEDTPLLWIIRDELGLKGTKYGCGIGMCGACTVHLEGEPIRSCSTPLSALANANITTIEGLHLSAQQPLRDAWIEAQVPQCGYCQSGQIMQAAGLLKINPNPSDSEISEYMTGNLCRCMSYSRIHKAVRSAGQSMRAPAKRGGGV